MPVINFSYSDLCGLIGREVPKEVLRERLPMIGADMKSVQDDSDELSFEFFPDRPDLFSVEGIARALRAFLGYEPGLRSYAVGESEVEVKVDPSVKDVRPYIWSAIVEGNEINDALIRSMMDLQEKLHVTIGRNRRKVAIGIHDLRAVKPPFTYKAVRPDEISFIPLQGTERMTPAEILQRHEKGMAYAFVLEGKERYPMIVDSEGEVLSFPPIINGIATAVTEETRDIFVDCTGTDIIAVASAVNILTSALAERGGKIKSVGIQTESGVHRAPDLASRPAPLGVEYVNRWIGTALKPDEMVDCLKRMGYGAGLDGPNSISVEIPAYRTDILHPVDLAEDVAIGYGFEKFGNKLPRHATFGVEDALTAYSEKVRPVLIGLGYFEVVTLSLSNPRDQYTLMNLPEDEGAVRVKNPVNVEHSQLRTSLLPSLLAILRKNKHRELPQRIFEIGDVVIDGVNKTYLSGVSIHAKASFTEGKSLIQSICSALGIDASVVADSNPSFIPGRAAGVVAGSNQFGVFGEVAPSAVESFELGYPIVAFELDLEALHRLGSGR